jgi:hypothetical protein
LIKREKRRGDKGQPCFTPLKGTVELPVLVVLARTINQNILVSIVHSFDNIDKVSGHPDII